MPDLSQKTYSEIVVGDAAQFEIEITEKMVDDFAALSGDVNPLHMDQSYGSSTQFGGRIAHGFLGASFFSRLIGMHVPGKYALYLSQQVLFRMPIRIGMKVRIQGSVVQKIDAGQAIKVKTQAIDLATGDCLIDGEAIVKVLK